MSFVAAAIGVGGALLGGAISAGGAESAASTQAAAERQAQATELGMFNTEQTNESPYIQSGSGAASQLNYLLGTAPQGGSNTATSSAAGGYGSLNAPFNASTFQSMSPAYQFQSQQGAQGTLNQDSSSQGAESGAALKDLMSYNQNYANTSFNNAFNQYQTQQNNIFGRLNSIATLGSNAGSNSATGASSFSNSIGNATAGVGSALAAGTVGAANAASGSLQNASNWLAGSQTGATGSPGYATNGGYVYNGVEQNGGQGGGIGNIVDDF